MKKYLFIFLLILCSFSVFADLVIDPSSISISAKKDQLYNFTLHLTNTYDFGVFDLSFTNFENISYPLNINLTRGSDQTIPFSLKYNMS